MEILTIEQKRIINPEFEEMILWLIEKIKKYHGKYNSKELKEWLTALLMLEIDIQKDNTYNEETLKSINKNYFVQEIINFNIYGNIRRFLENYDGTLTFPGGGYNGDGYGYPVWHDRFVPGEPNIPRGDSDKIEILGLSTPKNKTIITLTGTTSRSKKIRQMEIDKMIVELYKLSQEKPKVNFDPVIDYHYNMKLAHIIHILNDWACRCNDDRLVQPRGFSNPKGVINSIPEVDKKINAYVNELYKALNQEYGTFKEKFRRPEEVIGKIDVDTKGNITETYPIKETPVATWQKRIIHH